jgi:hypothetical protein
MELLPFEAFGISSQRACVSNHQGGQSFRILGSGVAVSRKVPQLVDRMLEGLGGGDNVLFEGLCCIFSTHAGLVVLDAEELCKLDREV